MNWNLIILPLFLAAAGIVSSSCNQTATSPGANSTDDSASADYPRKTVTVICPWAPGGGTDRLSRFVADQLQAHYGQPFVVANKTGGGGAVGHSAGALAKPDGHTLTMATFELSTMHWMGISDLTWADLDPLCQLNADAAALIVHKDAPWSTAKDLIDHIRAHPGDIKMSGTAAGGAWDLARAGLLLAADLPVDSVIWIPTQGAAPSLVELLGGHIDAVCCSVPEAASQIEAGELRVLAVMAPERLDQFPSIPTVIEQGIDWTAVGWRGLALPKDTPRPIRDSLLQAVQEITRSDRFKQFMNKNGFSIELKDPAEFADFLKTQDRQWQKVIEAAGYAKQG